MDQITHFSYTAHVVTATFTLLLVAVATLALTKRIRLPFTVVLVVVGMGLTTLANAFPTYFSVFNEIEISPDLILFIFLPTLIFESTFNLDSHQLRKNLGPIITLAVPGLLLSTVIIAAIVHWLTDIPWVAALLLGAILSATDPVAVISLFRQLGAPKRLIILVEGESLFNDATSIVLAKILIGIIAAGTVTQSALTGGIIDFFVLFIGGLLVGWLLGLLTGWLLGLVVDDAMIEISLTTALAYLSFLLAEEVFHVSGVMATVAAGITLGGWGRAKISAPVRDYLEHFWKYLAFIANALIFLLVGMKVDLAALASSLDILLVVIVAMLIARAVIIYGLTPMVGRLPGFKPVSRPYQTVMYWGGLRGAIALAIVLGLEHFEYSELFTVLVMGAVLFTLIVQGLSIGRLMKFLGLDKPPITDRLAKLEYRIIARETALQRVPELMQGGRFSKQVMNQLLEDIKFELTDAQQGIEVLRTEEMDQTQEINLLYLRAFCREHSSYNDMFARGHISEPAYRELLLTLSSQVEGIRSEGHFVHVRTHKFKRAIEPYFYAFLEHTPLLSNVGEQLRRNRLSINYENDWAHFQSTRLILEWLETSVKIRATSDQVATAVTKNYQRWQTLALKRLDRTAIQYPEFVQTVQRRLGHRTLLLCDASVIEKQEANGTLSQEMAEHLQHEIRQQLHSLREQKITDLQVKPIELLRSVPFFSDIPEKEAKALALQLKAHTYEERVSVITEGENSQSLYLIARGVVRVLKGKGKDRKELATLVSGEFFGEMSLLHTELRSATVETVSPCSLYELKRKDLKKAMQEFPIIREALEEADRKRREKE